MLRTLLLVPLMAVLLGAAPVRRAGDAQPVMGARSAAARVTPAAQLVPVSLNAAAPVADLTCKAYLLYDLGRERTLAVHNAYLRQPIASLTKLMTAIVADERLRFDGRYILTDAERKLYEVDTLRGDKMIEMMLVCSNNNMCRVVSRILAGGESGMVALMNQHAHDLGLTSTHFATVNGLPGGVQYSTMFDVLKLLKEAYSHPRLRAAMECSDCDLNGKCYKGTLADLRARHPELVAGKTGYTKDAGRCLALLCQSGGHQYALITLGSKNVKASFRDAEVLLKHYGLYGGDVAEWK